MIIQSLIAIAMRFFQAKKHSCAPPPQTIPRPPLFIFIYMKNDLSVNNGMRHLSGTIQNVMKTGLRTDKSWDDSWRFEDKRLRWYAAGEYSKGEVRSRFGDQEGPITESCPMCLTDRVSDYIVVRCPGKQADVWFMRVILQTAAIKWMNHAHYPCPLIKRSGEPRVLQSTTAWCWLTIVTVIKYTPMTP